MTRAEFLQEFAVPNTFTVVKMGDIKKVTPSDGGPEFEQMTVEIKEPQTRKASLPLPTGQELWVKGATSFVVKRDDIDLFIQGVDKATKQYSGMLKWDVERPQGRTINGTHTVTKRETLLLTSELLVDFASSKRVSNAKTRQESTNDMYRQLFGGTDSTTPTPVVTEPAKPEVKKEEEKVTPLAQGVKN